MSQFLFGTLAVLAPIAIYWFIVRPRLQSSFINLYSYIDGFWARWWRRAVAFRTMLFGAIGLMLPEVISAVAFAASSDLTFLPEQWQSWIRGAALVATMLGRAMATTPREEPPKG